MSQGNRSGGGRGQWGSGSDKKTAAAAVVQNPSQAFSNTQGYTAGDRTRSSGQKIEKVYLDGLVSWSDTPQGARVPLKTLFVVFSLVVMLANIERIMTVVFRLHIFGAAGCDENHKTLQ